MTRPPRRRGRRAPEGNPAPSVTPPHPNTVSDPIDFDERVEAQINWSMLRVIRSGEFRLAVRCPHCGRWIHNPDTKRVHRDKGCIIAQAPE